MKRPSKLKSSAGKSKTLKIQRISSSSIKKESKTSDKPIFTVNKNKPILSESLLSKKRKTKVLLSTALTTNIQIAKHKTS